MAQWRHNHGLKPTEWDALIEAVVHQGDYVLGQRKFGIDAIYKDDGSPQTLCDTVVESELKKVLASFGNHYAVISEEAPKQDNALAIQSEDYVWAIDPIDGTKSFIDGHDEFTINVALMSPPSEKPPHNRTPVLGIVYAPAKHEIYFTKLNGKSYYAETNRNHRDNGTPLFTDRPVAMESPDRISHHTQSGANVARIVVGHTEGAEEASFFGRNAEVLPVKHTGAYRTARVAAGAADAATFTASSAIWDVAAPDAVIRGAGGRAFPIDTRSQSITDNDMYYGADANHYRNGNLFETGAYVSAHPMMIAELQPHVSTGILISAGKGR
jgi:3'(2'), 5'-bisphosphate nucleotidase